MTLPLAPSTLLCWFKFPACFLSSLFHRITAVFRRFAKSSLALFEDPISFFVNNLDPWPAVAIRSQVFPVTRIEFFLSPELKDYCTCSSQPTEID